MANLSSPTGRRDLRELSTETLESVARGLTAAIKELEAIGVDASLLQSGLDDVEKELARRTVEQARSTTSQYTDHGLHRFCFGGE